MLDTESIIIITVCSCLTTVVVFLIKTCFLSKCTHLSVCCGLVDVTREVQEEMKDVALPVHLNIPFGSSIPSIIIPAKIKPAAVVLPVPPEQPPDP